MVQTPFFVSILITVLLFLLCTAFVPGKVVLTTALAQYYMYIAKYYSAKALGSSGAVANSNIASDYNDCVYYCCTFSKKDQYKPSIVRKPPYMQDTK